MIGAAKGMGEAHAKLCAERGATVLVTDYDAGGSAVAEAIVAAGGKAHFRTLDVASESQWTDCVDWAIRDFGKVDGLVNNAGFSRVTGFLDTDLSAHRAMIQVMLTAPVELSRLLLPGMIQRGFGWVLGTSIIDNRNIVTRRLGDVGEAGFLGRAWAGFWSLFGM